MKKCILALALGLCVSLGFTACYKSSGTKQSISGLHERVLTSQGVSNTITFGSLQVVNGQNDTIPRATPIGAGSSPGLMAISPTRNIVASFDASSNTVYAIDTIKEASIGNVRIAGPTSSMVVPAAIPLVYAAVPSAVVTGFGFQGAVQSLNFSTGSLSTIAVTSAQTVVANGNGTQLLVFSNDSDSMTLISPFAAVPPVDTSCLTAPNAVCTIVPGFSRPVFAIVSGNTAYVLNCGLQCGGAQPASVAVFDLGSLTVTQTIPVEAATVAFLSGSTLYVAGTPPTNNACLGQTTAATVCGRMDIVDLGSGSVVGTAIITNGYHDRIDMSANGQLFIGSHDCQSVGDVNNPTGEVRGCLTIYNTATGGVVIPPDNGNVHGLQGFSSRYIEYVAQGGNLRVYDTTKNILLINTFVPQGTINIPGFIGDAKAIDFF